MRLHGVRAILRLRCASVPLTTATDRRVHSWLMPTAALRSAARAAGAFPTGSMRRSGPSMI